MFEWEWNGMDLSKWTDPIYFHHDSYVVPLLNQYDLKIASLRSNTWKYKIRTDGQTCLIHFRKIINRVYLKSFRILPEFVRNGVGYEQ